MSKILTGSAKDIRYTFGMIKPEAIERKLVDEILLRIDKAGLLIDDMKLGVLDYDQFYTIYGHTQGKPWFAEMGEYMTTKPSIALAVGGKDAVARLFELRGASDAGQALPGTIRGDYARDQSYQLIPKGVSSRNVFHAPETVEEAEAQLALFFGDKYRMPGGKG